MIAEWAEKLRSDDPDRFAAILAAPASTRERLITLAALNLELARLAWVSENTLIVQMRLQWWQDVVTGKSPAAGPLAEAVMALDLPTQDLQRLISARIYDRADFSSEAELWDYLDDTAGSLARLSAAALGAEDIDAAGQIGQAQGLLNWLRAVPKLRAGGFTPLPDESAEAVAALAKQGLARMGEVSEKAFPATLAAWQVKSLLGYVVKNPEAVLQGQVFQSEFRRRISLLWRASRGRW